MNLENICDCSWCRYAILSNGFAIGCELGIKIKQIFLHAESEYIMVPDTDEFTCEFYNDTIIKDETL